jgi:hypothetical protein
VDDDHYGGGDYNDAAMMVTMIKQMIKYVRKEIIL